MTTLDIYIYLTYTESYQKICLTRTNYASYSATYEVQEFSNIHWLYCPHFHHWSLKAPNIMFLGNYLMDVSYLFLFCWFFVISAPPLHKLEPFISNMIIVFHKEIYYHTEVLSFSKLVFNLNNPNLLGLIHWNINGPWKGWIIIWLVASYRNRFINFVIRRTFHQHQGVKHQV